MLAMKKIVPLATLLLSVVFGSSFAAGPSLAPDSRVFELRTYHASPGKFEALHSRFRDHTNALFKKRGLTVVGYWVPMDADKGSADTLVYLLTFKDRAAADAAHRAIMNPRCQPWPLAQEKFNSWKTITFNFDPRDY